MLKFDKVRQKIYSCRGRLIEFNFPLVMGIVNCTPDSFYEGSRFESKESAVEKALKMWEQGASIIDIGGVSTRPGSDPPEEEEEMKRVIPVIEVLHKHAPEMIISIDTWRHRVARKAIAAGACMVNDVSGGHLDPDMYGVIAASGVPYIIMHMPGTPATMQQLAVYEDVVFEVMQYMANLKIKLNELGIYDIIIDPGFGFGKKLEHNYRLLYQLNYFKHLDLPVLAGLSRKSMIYRPLDKRPEDILHVVSALHWEALVQGADILRVHDVPEAVDVVRLFSATFEHRKPVNDTGIM